MEQLCIGDKIKFLRPDGVIAEDTVRAFEQTTIVLMPYAPNKTVPAIVLTNHSWCQPSDLVR
jgi:hypothetical protein